MRHRNYIQMKDKIALINNVYTQVQRAVNFDELYKKHKIIIHAYKNYDELARKASKADYIGSRRSVITYAKTLSAHACKQYDNEDPFILIAREDINEVKLFKYNVTIINLVKADIEIQKSFDKYVIHDEKGIPILPV